MITINTYTCMVTSSLRHSSLDINCVFTVGFTTYYNIIYNILVTFFIATTLNHVIRIILNPPLKTHSNFIKYSELLAVR